eukprot:SAG11_NODE_17207_length_525_cov_0.915493_1_plen_135_part_10
MCTSLHARHWTTNPSRPRRQHSSGYTAADLAAPSIHPFMSEHASSPAGQRKPRGQSLRHTAMVSQAQPWGSWRYSDRHEAVNDIQASRPVSLATGVRSDVTAPLRLRGSAALPKMREAIRSWGLRVYCSAIGQRG